MTCHLVFSFLEVVTIHKCHYLYCAAVWMLGALRLHKPGPNVCECVAYLSSDPAAYALPLCRSPLQPDSLAGAPYLLYPCERYNLQFFHLSSSDDPRKEH